MSEITNKDIQKIAKLARIKIPEGQCDHFSEDLRGILTWVEDLKEVDTDDIEPMLNVHGESLRLEKDEISDGNIADDVLKNAKHAKYGYFAVPKVLE